MKIRNLNLPDPQGPAQACSGTALPLLTTKQNTSWFIVLHLVLVFCTTLIFFHRITVGLGAHLVYSVIDLSLKSVLRLLVPVDRVGGTFESLKC